MKRIYSQRNIEALDISHLNILHDKVILFYSITINISINIKIYTTHRHTLDRESNSSA